MVDGAVSFVHTYPLDSNLSIGWRHPPLSNWASVEIKRVLIVSKINPGLYMHAGSLFEAMFSFLNRIRKIGSF